MELIGSYWNLVKSPVAEFDGNGPRTKLRRYDPNQNLTKFSWVGLNWKSTESTTTKSHLIGLDWNSAELTLTENQSNLIEFV